MTMKAKKGFTLVELLVVIAIIGILAAVGVTALSGARAKARDAKRVADMKQIQSALELYYNDQQFYPAGSALALGALTDCTTACDTISSTNGINATAAGTTYMGLVPKDPSAQTAECASGSTAVCHYSYTATPADCNNTTTNCTGYNIYAYLEGAAGGLTAGLICGDQNGVANTTCP
jgi:prepilin-type N-terminal cleavage/methylation domain-containing protein